MFRCQICRENSSHFHQLVTHQREVHYSNIYLDKRKQGKKVLSSGLETVKEISVCPSCYEKEKDKYPIKIKGKIPIHVNSIL